MSLGQLQEPLELMTLGPDVVTEYNRNHSGGSGGSSTWWRVMHGAVSQSELSSHTVCSGNWSPGNASEPAGE